MSRFIKFSNSEYVKVARPDSFTAETNRIVTKDTNARLGTSYDPSKSFRKDAKLSVDHKLAIEVIAQRLVALLNRVHKSSDHSQTAIEASVRLYKADNMDILYPTATDKLSNAQMALMILSSTLITSYDNPVGAPPDTDAICDAADSLLLQLHNSPDNLRDGHARVNSAIQEKFDPHIITKPDGSEQMTPRSKGMGKSEYRKYTGVSMTPTKNHYLSSDFINKRKLSDLTPDSRATIDGMENIAMKKNKKW